MKSTITFKTETATQSHIDETMEILQKANVEVVSEIDDLHDEVELELSSTSEDYITYIVDEIEDATPLNCISIR